MTLIDSIRRMDKRLRVMLIATAILLIPQIGQLIAIRDINTSGHESDLAMVFMFAGIMVIPTSVILSSVIMYILRKTWREHEPIFILGGINLLIALSLIWFVASSCSWAAVFGIHIRGC